jgi:uncharacterized tellurite resistance protein B-like protein
MESPILNLHYAIGQLAYAVAHADGVVQPEERQKFQNIVEAELRCRDYDFDLSEIIFKIMDRDNHDSKTVYQWAMNEIRNNSHYLSPELKRTFVKVMEKIARAYPPVTDSEQRLIDQFKKDIEPLEGDPVFYKMYNLK